MIAMTDFSEFSIDIEKHITKLGKDIQQFVERVVPIGDEDRDFIPDCDIIESDAAFKVLIDLPGLSKKDINIALKDNVLTIKGERIISFADGEEAKRQERRHGAFARSFGVPKNVNAAEIKAAFKNGVLTISMPKSEALKDTQSIPIN